MTRQKGDHETVRGFRCGDDLWKPFELKAAENRQSASERIRMLMAKDIAGKSKRPVSDTPNP